jgi:hypothetical protein
MPVPAGQPGEARLGAIVIDKAAVLLPPAPSETRTENNALDAALGVPEMWPVALRDKPGGSDPELTDQV